MDISYLSDFLSIAEELNFSRAAKSRNISQPALSNHIIALETELGVRLFERTKRHVSLTHEGKLLLSDAQRIMEIFDKMHRFDKCNLLDNRIITVGGFLDNLSVLGLLAQRINDFARLRGFNLKMICDYDNVENPVEKLECKKLDMCVGYENSINPESHPDIQSMPFYQDPFYVILNKENPLAQKTCVALEDLRDLAFVKLVGPQFASGLEQLLSACKRHGFEPKLHSTYVNSISDCSLIEIGVNKCFVFAYGGFSGGFAFRARPELAVLPVEGEHFAVSLFYSRTDQHSLLRAFLDYVDNCWQENRV